MGPGRLESKGPYGSATSSQGSGRGRIRWERDRADSRAPTRSLNLAKLGLSVYICEMGTTQLPGTGPQEVTMRSCT